MMKRLFFFYIIASLLVAPVFAAEGAKDSADTNSAQVMQTCPYYSMSMMTPEQFKVMHDHMQQMQSLMDSIKQEKDPQKYWQLMHQHMMSMSEGMHMMNGPMMHGYMMNGGMMNGQMNGPMMHGGGAMMPGNGQMMQGNRPMMKNTEADGMMKNQDATPMNMEQQMQVMQQRMGVMQMMLEQMMEHEMQRERGNHSGAKNP